MDFGHKSAELSGSGTRESYRFQKSVGQSVSQSHRHFWEPRNHANTM